MALSYHSTRTCLHLYTNSLLSFLSIKFQSLLQNLLQVAIHAIGDRANEMVLDMYRSVALTNGMRDRRFRVKFIAQNEKGSPKD